MTEPNGVQPGSAKPGGAKPRVVAERTADLANNTGGGVMTEEVGAITGDLTLRSELRDDSTVVLRVQYKDAAEWYTVDGGTCRVTDHADLDAIHSLAVGLLHRPGG